MSDAFRDLLDSIGTEAFGLAYKVQRAGIHEWLERNPLKVHRWRQEIREAVAEGRL